MDGRHLELQPMGVCTCYPPHGHCPMTRHGVRSMGQPAIPVTCRRRAHASPRRLFRRLALAQRTRLRPQLQGHQAADPAAAAAIAAAAAAGGGGKFAASSGSWEERVLAAARMVEGMPRLSALDLSDVGDDFAFTAFLLVALRHLQARQHMTAVVGYSTDVLRTVDLALLAVCLPHLQQFQGDLPYACGAWCLRALARVCPLQQLSCNLDRCDESMAAAIGACATLRGLKLEFERRPETEDASISITRRVVDSLLLPALAGLTRLTSLEVSYCVAAEIDVPDPDLLYPDLAPLAALTALQQLRLMLWCHSTNDVNGRLSQLPAGSLSALKQLRLHSANVGSMVCVDDVGLAALARAAPALLELDVEYIKALDEVAQGSAPPWTMPHLTTLHHCYHLFDVMDDGMSGHSVSVVLAAALLARAPRLRWLWAELKLFAGEEPLVTHVRALARIAAAGRSALNTLAVWLPPAAELQAAMAVAAPGGIALVLPTLKVVCREALVPLDDQQVAWLCSVVAEVDLVDVHLRINSIASGLSRGIFALPAAAFCLRVPYYHGRDNDACLLEAVTFAAEAARPGQHVCVRARHGAFGTDAMAEAVAIAHGALGKDIRVQIGGQLS